MCNMGVFPFRLIQGLGLGLRLGQGLELRHDNSFVHIRRGLGEMEQNCNMITPEPLETSSRNCQSIILYGGKGG